MAWYSASNLWSKGKMALNSAVNGAKLLIPYVKSALPIVSKIANGLSYVPVIGTAAKIVGSASDYLNNNIGYLDRGLSSLEKAQGIVNSISEVVGQPSSVDPNLSLAYTRKAQPVTAPTSFDPPPLYQSQPNLLSSLYGGGQRPQSVF